MIQDQLVDYISSQMKLGVSEEAIKTTLVSAGWAATDVEDTLKKAKGPAVAPVQPAKSVITSTVTTSSVTTGTISPMGAKIKSPDSQVIRVSDLVSASSPSAISSTGAVMTPQKNSAFPKTMMSSTTPMGVQSQTSSGTKGKGMGMVLTVILVVLVLAFAGLAGYFFFQNMSLKASVGTVSTQTQDVTAQIAALQTQIQSANASSTALVAELASLSADNQELRTDLSLFVTPAGNVTTTDISLAGLVSGGKPTYIIMTVSGARASIKNSADSIVRALLQPLVNTSTTVRIGGTFIPGSSVVTILTVNGISVAPPASSTIATTTATSTPIVTASGTATTTPGL